MKHLLGLIVACALLFASTEQASAQLGCGYGGFGGAGYGYGLGFYGSPYAAGRIPTPPYFALHPPVYYSDVVPRTYGHSPFAYPGTHVTPDLPMQAKLIENPHVVPTNTESPIDVNLTAEVKPKEVLNPFVMSTESKVVSYVVD